MSNNREDNNNIWGGTGMGHGNFLPLPGSKFARKPTAATADGSNSSDRGDGSEIPRQTHSPFTSSPSPRTLSGSVPPRRPPVRLPGETPFPIQSTTPKRDVFGKIIFSGAKTQPTVTSPQFPSPSRSRSLADLLSEVSDQGSESPPAKKPKFGLQGLIEKHRQDMATIRPETATAEEQDATRQIEDAPDATAEKQSSTPFPIDRDNIGRDIPNSWEEADEADRFLMTNYENKSYQYIMRRWMEITGEEFEQTDCCARFIFIKALWAKLDPMKNIQMRALNAAKDQAEDAMDQINVARRRYGKKPWTNAEIDDLLWKHVCMFYYKIEYVHYPRHLLRKKWYLDKGQEEPTEPPNGQLAPAGPETEEHEAEERRGRREMAELNGYGDEYDSYPYSAGDFPSSDSDDAETDKEDEDEDGDKEEVDNDDNDENASEDDDENDADDDDENDADDEQE